MWIMDGFLGTGMGWMGLFADLALISALVFGVYYRRHRKRHMIVPYIGINIGVYAVVIALLGADIGIGVAFGLFGVLSIIRLRSNEISHPDVSYYFSSLAIGLVCGVPLDPLWTGPILGCLIVGILALVDQPAEHAELLLLAAKGSWRVTFVPVRWQEDPDSRVRVIQTAWEDVRGLMRIRRRIRSTRHPGVASVRGNTSGRS
jgi:hypothetical protein